MRTKIIYFTNGTMAGSSGFPSSYDPSKYYDPEIQTVHEPARVIFEEYSKIPNERIVSHINETVSSIV